MDRETGRTVRLTAVACRTRGCPICGPIWVARNKLLIAWRLTTCQKAFYGECDRESWPTLYRRLLRAKSDYDAVEVGEGRLAVLASVAVLGVTEPYSTEAAQEMAAWMVENARPVLKPILLSKGWAMPKEPKQPKQKTGKGKPDGRARWREVEELASASWEDILAAAESLGLRVECKAWGATCMVEFDVPTELREEFYRLATNPPPLTEEQRRRVAMWAKG